MNIALDEYHATVSPDRRELYFVRTSYAPRIAGSLFTVPVSRLRTGFTFPHAR